MDITKIDKNFQIKVPDTKDGITFFDIDEAPFSVHGLIREDGIYKRIPQKIADKTNEGVTFLTKNTAGGRVRFSTDSDIIEIKAYMHSVGKMPHFALTGSVGFDIYIKKDKENIYYKTFVPPFDTENGYESTVTFETKEMREITINFPLYSGVTKLFVGLCDKSTLSPAPDYKIKKPVVFYGSSITQGGCASRPGNSYQAIFSRKLNCEYINLGFSGSARGEDEIANYIKNLEMSAFVYDYDHNAPTTEHLEKTHERMFNIIRSENPDLPILMLSRPKSHLTDDEKRRIEIIRNTYNKALENGDKNVYFIPGNDLIEDDFKETFSVDDCHPNDSGFVSMAKVITRFFEENIL